MNDKLLKEFKELLLNELFPVGKTEIFYDSNDHSNYLGFTWQRTALDRFIKGYSPSVNTIASTGGEKTHKLTIDEMPKHKHGIQFDQTAGGQTSAFKTGVQTVYAGEYDFIKEKGGDQPHNNEPQFQVFAIWRRVS